MKYQDLSGSLLTGVQSQMRCSECGDGPYSADRGDYFWAPDNADVECGECGGAMELGRMITAWTRACRLCGDSMDGVFRAHHHNDPVTGEVGSTTYTVAIGMLLAGLAYIAAHVVVWAWSVASTVQGGLK